MENLVPAAKSWVDENIINPLDGTISAAQSLYAAKIGDQLEEKVEEMDDGLQKAYIAGIMQLVGTTAVTIIVLLYIISAIVETMPTPTNEKLNQTTTTVIDTTSSSMNLGTVALIVIVAGAILFYVRGFGGGNDGYGGMR